MNFVNLDDTTRPYMLQEVESDIAAGRLYLSRRFTDKGMQDYPALLREAVSQRDAEWLAQQLSIENRMRPAELSHSRTGTAYVKRTPFSDHETAAFGEYNRYYIRGLCARAIAEGIKEVIVYRALEVAQERGTSASLIGSSVDPAILLADLRENIGKGTRLGIPSGPNSGISVKLP